MTASTPCAQHPRIQPGAGRRILPITGDIGWARHADRTLPAPDRPRRHARPHLQHHSGLTDITAWGLAGSACTNAQSRRRDLSGADAFPDREYGAGRRCILIVDEAQNLTGGPGELRLLSNINRTRPAAADHPGRQPELLVKLKSPELAQFAQRISISYHLTPLNYATPGAISGTACRSPAPIADLQAIPRSRGAVFSGGVRASSTRSATWR